VDFVAARERVVKSGLANIEAVSGWNGVRTEKIINLCPVSWMGVQLVLIQLFEKESQSTLSFHSLLTSCHAIQSTTYSFSIIIVHK
jgi:hypothetical protein